MKRYALLLFVLIAPAAFANTFQLTYHSTMAFSGGTEDGDTSHEGFYTSWNDPRLGVNMSGFASGSIHGASFWLAPWDTITSATMYLSFGDGGYGGIAYVGPVQSGPPGDQDHPSIPPTFYPGSASGLPASVSLDDLYFDPSTQVFDLSSWLIFDRNHLYTDPSSTVDVTGFIALVASVKDPGSNWSGYIGGSGTAEVPYSLTIQGTYVTPPVPEPSTLLLLATGIVGLATHFRRFANTDSLG